MTDEVEDVNTALVESDVPETEMAQVARVSVDSDSRDGVESTQSSDDKHADDVMTLHKCHFNPKYCSNEDDCQLTVHYCLNECGAKVHHLCAKEFPEEEGEGKYYCKPCFEHESKSRSQPMSLSRSSSSSDTPRSGRSHMSASPSKSSSSASANSSSTSSSIVSSGIQSVRRRASSSSSSSSNTSGDSTVSRSPLPSVLSQDDYVPATQPFYQPGQIFILFKF